MVAARASGSALKGRCIRCNDLGLKSTVPTGGGSVMTTMGYTPFYDDQGVYHDHDMNWAGASFRCSQGHMWTERWQRECPARGCTHGSGSREVTYVD